jgi:hypothetical protein
MNIYVWKNHDKLCKITWSNKKFSVKKTRDESDKWKNEGEEGKPPDYSGTGSAFFFHSVASGTEWAVATWKRSRISGHGRKFFSQWKWVCTCFWCLSSSENMPCYQAGAGCCISSKGFMLIHCKLKYLFCLKLLFILVFIDIIYSRFCYVEVLAILFKYV